MKRAGLFIIALCLLITATTSAQNLSKISFIDIEEAISNPEGPFFYPNLLDRYNSFDSTLTVIDYAHIYYGFSFQKEYLNNQPSENRLNQLMEKGQFEEAVAEANKILDRNPVSLEANNLMAYALFQLKKPESEWQIYRTRYQNFVKVITQSGDGLSPASAFKVIYVSDEYNIMLYHFEIPEVVFRHQLVNAGYDYFKIKPSRGYKANEIYFEIPEKLNEIHKQRAREKAAKKAQQKQ